MTISFYNNSGDLISLSSDIRNIDSVDFSLDNRFGNISSIEKKLSSPGLDIISFDLSLWPEISDFFLSPLILDCYKNIEALQLHVISISPYNLQFIPSPFDSVIDLAIDLNPHCIQFISNPSFDLQLKVVSSKPSLIRFISSPFDSIQELSVSSNPRFIDYIDKPSLRSQKIAVSSSFNAISYISKPSNSVVDLAIKSDGRSISYISKPSFDLICLAISSSPSIIVDFILHPKFPELLSFAFSIDHSVISSFNLSSLKKSFLLLILSLFDSSDHSKSTKAILIQQIKSFLL